MCGLTPVQHGRFPTVRTRRYACIGQNVPALLRCHAAVPGSVSLQPRVSVDPPLKAFSIFSAIQGSSFEVQWRYIYSASGIVQVPELNRWVENRAGMSKPIYFSILNSAGARKMRVKSPVPYPHYAGNFSMHKSVSYEFLALGASAVVNHSQEVGGARDPEFPPCYEGWGASPRPPLRPNTPPMYKDIQKLYCQRWHISNRCQLHGIGPTRAID